MRWDHKEYIFAGNRAISVWTVPVAGVRNPETDVVMELGAVVFTTDSPSKTVRLRSGRVKFSYATTSAQPAYWSVPPAVDWTFATQ